MIISQVAIGQIEEKRYACPYHIAGHNLSEININFFPGTHCIKNCIIGEY